MVKFIDVSKLSTKECNRILIRMRIFSQMTSLDKFRYFCILDYDKDLYIDNQINNKIKEEFKEDCYFYTTMICFILLIFWVLL